MILMGQDVEHERGLVNETTMVGSQVSKVSLVQDLLQDLGTALLRPLFAELALQNSPRYYAASGTTKNNSSFKKKQRRWIELLDDALVLLPYCNDDEYGEILRIMSVFLLAFLLPYSTGMDYYLLQNMKDRPSTAASRNARSPVDEYIIQMSLEERLEKTLIHSLSTNQYGSDECSPLPDIDVEVALGDLLDRISRILQRRPVHSHQVELIHLFAMIIHPHHGTDSAAIEKGFDPSLDRGSPGYENALRFMNNPVGLQFQIHYGHRRQLVQMVQSVLFLPELSSGGSPLFSGALPHLFASLRQFGCHTSKNANDAHDALAAIVSLVVQFRCNKHDDSLHSIVKSEWDWLLHGTIDVRSALPCRCQCHAQKSAETFEKTDIEREESEISCTFDARGRLLSRFIERKLERKTDPSFLAHAAQSLADAIEWQLDCWSVDAKDASPSVFSVSNMSSPCLVTSLLVAAKQLFCPWILGHYGVTADDDPFATILRCSVQFLGHSDSGIVTSAAGLLVQAFSYDHMDRLEPYPSLIAVVLSSENFQRVVHGKSINSLLAAVSSQSPSFALTVLNFILKEFDSAVGADAAESIALSFNENSKVLIDWLVAIAINQPEVCVKKTDTLLAFFQNRTFLQEQLCQLSHALFYTRQTHFFDDITDSTICEAIETFVNLESTNFWVCYQVGRNAMISGNARVAQNAFRKILHKCAFIDPAQYLWLSVIERIAVADAFLTKGSRLISKESVLDIPSASKALYSACSYMESLRSSCNYWKDGAAFQIRFLYLRLDLLDLVIVLRQLTRERRLTARGPLKGTRSYLHLRNVVRCFDVLAFRYHELIVQFGLFFKHHQSITSLSMLQMLSSFLSHATKACFSDVFNARKNRKKASVDKSPFFKANITLRHPMAFLIERLDELVVQPMLQADVTDPLIRAVATLELIDGLLLVPFPIPRDFFQPFPSVVPELLISAAPNPVFCEFDESFSIIEAAPFMGFSFSVSGHFPVQFFQHVRVPTWTMILWFQIKYSGPLVLDDDDNNDLTGGDNNFSEVEPSISTKSIRIPDLSAVSPATSALSVNGFFFFTVECPPLMEEGLYLLNTKLGCRDIHGNEWEIPSCRPDSLVATIRVSSSRSVLELEKASNVG